MTQTLQGYLSDTSQATFVQHFGDIYEHSPWVAEAAYGQLKPDQKSDIQHAIKQAMRACVDQADYATKLALIRQHPDLAGKAAKAGELTQASSQEQASAGLDQLSETEYAQFQRYNDQYLKQFGFPFIKAIRQSNKALILSAYETRLQHDSETEFATAINEIHQIASFRIDAWFAQHTT